MGHLTRPQQFQYKVRKAANPKVRITKRHGQKVKYDRKQTRQEIDEQLKGVSDK